MTKLLAKIMKDNLCGPTFQTRAAAVPILHLGVDTHPWQMA
jgi:hypothetical protein